MKRIKALILAVTCGLSGLSILVYEYKVQSELGIKADQGHKIEPIGIQEIMIVLAGLLLTTVAFIVLIRLMTIKE